MHLFRENSCQECVPLWQFVVLYDFFFFKYSYFCIIKNNVI